MLRKQRKKTDQIYHGLNHFIIHYPIIMVSLVLGLFYYTYTTTGIIAKAQTVAFLAIAMSEVYQAYASRSIRYSSFKVGLFKNKYLVLATAVSVIVSALVIYVPFLQEKVFMTFPLSGMEFLGIVAISSIGFIYLELYKLRFGNIQVS